MPFLGIAAILCALIASCGTPPAIIDVSPDETTYAKLPALIPYGYPCTKGAHRGASNDFQENSFDALCAANTNDLYKFIEFDIQYSADNRIVVFHDKTMLRMFGSARSVGNTTFDELNEIAEGGIAAYEDVMDAMTKKLNIEIKSQGDLEEDMRLVDEVMIDLKRRNRLHDVVMSSISREVVQYISQTYPDMPTGQIFWKLASTFLRTGWLTEDLYDEIRETEADYLMLNVANLHNIKNLVELKPLDKTLVFWDFDDTMYLVHKDPSDVMWGTQPAKQTL